MAGQTVNLPQIENKVPQIAEPRSGVSASQVASPYVTLARTMEKAGAELTDIAKITAKEAGLSAVGRDEQGNVTVERLPIIGDAAIVYQNSVEMAAMADAEAVAKNDFIDLRKQHRDDPEAFRAAAHGYRVEKVSQYKKVAGAEVGLNLGRLIDNLTTENYRALRNEKESRDLTRSSNAITAQIAGTTNELFALAAQGLDKSNPGFQQRLQKVGSLYGSLLQNPRSGMTPERMDYEISQLGAELEVAKIGANLEKTIAEKGVEGALAEAEKVRTDPTLNLTPAQRTAAYTRMVSLINQRQTAKVQEANGVINEINATRKLIEGGGTVSPERWASLTNMAAGDPLLTAQVETLNTVAPTLADWRKSSPVQLQKNMDAIAAAEREHGSTPASRMLMESGKKMLTEMNAALKTDPLGWANGTGSVQVPDLDFAAQDFPQQMRWRVAAAETVAATYNVAPVYLKPHEKQQLIAATNQGGQAMIDAAAAVVTGAGDRAPKVFKEIGGDAPLTAHIGNIVNNQGSPEVVKDAADAIRFKQDKDFKAPNWFKNPGDKVTAAWREVAVDTYGGAMIAAPKTQMAAEGTAQAAFGIRAIRNNYDPLFIDDSGKAKDAYRRALQESVGATFDATGAQYGGITSMRADGGFFGTSRKVLVPTNIRADRFQDVIGQLRDEDLGGKWTANGKTYSVKDLRNATPVATAQGYWFAAGDPASTNPQWIPDATGQRPLLVNFDALESVLRTRTIGAYKGQ